MRDVHTGAWRAFTAVTAALGVCFALFTLPLNGVLLGAGLGGAVGVAVHGYLAPFLVLLKRPVTRHHSAQVLALGVLAALGLGAVLGPGAAALWVLMEVGAGWPLRTTGPPFPIQREGADESFAQAGTWPFVEPVTTSTMAHPPEDQPVNEERLSTWSCEELCWAWRASFSRLERVAGDAAGTARVAEERHALLEEIARRDPAGFAAWITAGARAASNPRRYLA